MGRAPHYILLVLVNIMEFDICSHGKVHLVRTRNRNQVGVVILKQLISFLGLLDHLIQYRSTS